MLKEIIGGIDGIIGGMEQIPDRSYEIKIYGANKQDTFCTICNYKTVLSIKHKLYDWTSFLNVHLHGSSPDIDFVEQKKFMKTVRRVLDLPKGLSDKATTDAINKILAMDKHVLLQKLKLDFDTHGNLVSAANQLYLSLESMFEMILNKYMTKLDNQSDQGKRGKRSKRGRYKLSDLHKIDVRVKNIRQTRDLSNQIKKYNHKHFIKNKPITSLINILQFPFSQFEQCLTQIDPTYEIIQFDKVYNDLHTHSTSILTLISKLKDIATSNHKASSGSGSANRKYMIYKNPSTKEIIMAVNKILSKYNKIRKSLENMEALYDESALVLSKITKKIRILTQEQT